MQRQIQRAESGTFIQSKLGSFVASRGLAPLGAKCQGSARGPLRRTRLLTLVNRYMPTKNARDSDRLPPVACVLAFFAAAACLPLLAAGPDRADREVVVRTVAPQPVRGRLRSFRSPTAWSSGQRRAAARFRRATSCGSTPWTIRGANPSLGMVATTPPAATWTLILGDGDRWEGRIADGRDEQVIVEVSDAGQVSLPIGSLASVTSAKAFTAAYSHTVEWFQRAPISDDDLLLLTNGDVLRGFVASFDKEGLTFDRDGGAARVPCRMLLAVRFARPSIKPIDSLLAVIRLRDGTRMTATALELSGDGCEARLPLRARVLVPVDRIRRIDMLGGRWERLSTLTPVSHEQASMLGLIWEPQTDQNVLGGPLSVAGEAFDYGVGVHSRSKLGYELKGEFHEFVTFFGLDDAGGPLADVRVAIVVDDVTRYEEPHVRSGKLFGPVRIDVSRAQRLELLVDFGENGDLQDRFDWIEPGLVR